MLKPCIMRYLSLAALILTLIVSVNSVRQCAATCSPHITLPCSFGSLDRCIERTCKDLCWKDDNRPMNSCYCRGAEEGRTLRACFCGPSTLKGQRNRGKTIVF
ncbi:hypothetical protein AB6A40_010001 [Gnathostoma spinigerum]|uniref:Uncharacterized protein n=1 Tax=Gnathostoma spinigerum TaxID=75299 RepID=A0ABD6EW10_9BILA